MYLVLLYLYMAALLECTYNVYLHLHPGCIRKHGYNDYIRVYECFNKCDIIIQNIEE